MANRWTGAYDAVLELAPAGIDILLAVLHRKGRPSENPNGPHLLRNGWFNLPLGGGGGNGAAGLADLKGHLQFQVSTPSISVPDPDSNRVTVSAEVYSWFQRAFGSAPAPEFLHGSLSLTVDVDLIQCSGQKMVQVGIGTDDVRFVPAPGSGATAQDVDLVESILPAILGDGFQPVQQPIGTIEAGSFTVGRLDFKSLRRGSRSAIALLLGLGDTSGPIPLPSGVTEVFVGPADHAALAFGREFLARTLFAMAQGPLADAEVGGSAFGVDFEASPDPSSLEIDLVPGAIRARIDGTGSTSPGGPFGFRLELRFGMTVSGGRLLLDLAEEPEVDITDGNDFLKFVLSLFKGKAVDEVEKAANKVIAAANLELNKVVDESVGGLMEDVGLPATDLAFSSASIDPDGVVVGGLFAIGPAPPVDVRFKKVVKQTGGGPVGSPFSLGEEYSAFESWIPGGTIERYRWREIRGDGSVARQATDAHRFVLRLLPVLAPDSAGGGGSSPLTGAAVGPILGWPPTSWCLEVRGTQFGAGSGPPVPVARQVCGMSVVVASLDVAGSERLPVDVPDGRGGVLANVDPWGPFRSHAFLGDTERRGLMLLHHAGSSAEASVKLLRDVLPDPVPGPLVLPTVIVERGAAVPRPTPETAAFAFTSDPEGAWRKRFRLDAGGTVLLGPGGTEVFRDAGPLNAEKLMKVLEGLREEKPRIPRVNDVRLGPQLGELAPDFLFPCGGLVVALQKIRTREVDVCFWTTWSEPSLEELRRLHAARDGDDAPLVLCVNDGEDPEVARAKLKELGLEGELVPDPGRRIARAYGIHAWPTVVRVNEQGSVSDVRIGLEPELADGPADVPDDPAYPDDPGDPCDPKDRKGPQGPRQEPYYPPRQSPE